jgi:hypothetical protein
MDQSGVILYISTGFGMPLKEVFSTNSDEAIPGISESVLSVVRI